MKKLTLIATMTAYLAMSSALYGQNVVTDWATIVQPLLNTPPKLPAIQLVLRATVQLAVYDAVVAIDGGYRPFAATISAPAGADVRAAVATAAYRTTLARVDASQAHGFCFARHYARRDRRASYKRFRLLTAAGHCGVGRMITNPPSLRSAQCSSAPICTM